MPIRDFAVQGNAILGTRGSGKTYSATYLAEQLLEAEIPFVTFDPIGVWHNLKIPGAGRGYQVVVAGGAHADLKLTVATAKEIVGAAMRNNVPLVLDLYDPELSKADWKRIVLDCVSLLLYENTSLRHIFLEEAAEFVPQQISRGGGLDGQVYAAIEKLARMGGNRSLGYTLINQRAQQVNKAVLELCDCVLLHRQRGANSLKNIDKWMEYAGDDAKEIANALPNMAPGECFLWLPENETPLRVQIGRKKSFHPDRAHPKPPASVAKGIADVTGFIETLRVDLGAREAAVEEEKSEIDSLKGELAEMRKAHNALVIENRRLVEGPANEINHLAAEKDALIRKVLTGCDEIGKNHEFLGQSLDSLREMVEDVLNAPTPPPAALAPRRAPAAPRRATRPTVASNGSTKLSRMASMILGCLAQHHPRPRTKTQVALQIGRSARGGGFNNALSELRTAGYMVGSNPLEATPEGIGAAGHVDPLPRGRDLVEHWLGQVGAAERDILRECCDAYPRGLTREDLGERTGRAHGGGGFNNALSRLRTLGLVTGKGGEPIRASEDFFK